MRSDSIRSSSLPIYLFLIQNDTVCLVILTLVSLQPPPVINLFYFLADRLKSSWPSWLTVQKLLSLYRFHRSHIFLSLKFIFVSILAL